MWEGQVNPNQIYDPGSGSVFDPDPYTGDCAEQTRNIPPGGDVTLILGPDWPTESCVDLRYTTHEDKKECKKIRLEAVSTG